MRMPQVAREVFNRCLMGELGDKTRVLVTNQLQFVSAADTVIFMANGKVAEIGSYSQLMSRGDSFAQLMSQAEVSSCLLLSLTPPTGSMHTWCLWHTEGISVHPMHACGPLHACRTCNSRSVF
jgi:hypothetical protein